MACYSRDMMTGPTRLLSAMILNIRLGNFVPDATRSGWMSAKQVPLEVIPIGAEHGEDQEGSEAELAECESLAYTPSIQGPDGESLPHSPASLRSFELVENATKGELVDSDLGLGLDQVGTAADKWLTSLELFGDTEDIPRPSAEGPPGDAGAVLGEFNGEFDDAGEELVESASSDDAASSHDGNETDEEGFQEEQGFIGTSNIKRLIEGDLLQHKKTRVLHRVDIQKSSVIEEIYAAMCGATGASYRRLPRGANFQWPMCQKCYMKVDAIDRFVAQEEASKRRRLSKDSTADYNSSNPLGSEKGVQSLVLWDS